MKPKKAILLGSGALKIGEAGEFDYSGSQCIKALKEEGIQTILVNPNIATIQTDEKLADKVYFKPVKPKYLEKIIRKERPDGILLGFGGQTALNCGVDLEERRVLKRFGVRVLGTQTNAIEKCEGREEFKKAMKDINLISPKSGAASSLSKAKGLAKKIGYPLIIRPDYILGGQGAGIAHNGMDLERIVSKALAKKRTKQVLVEEYLDGWKEVEFEVLRDYDDNCIVVCAMENLDPMGIHTGESIVVAPIQTLTNREFQLLRELSIKVIRSLGIVGECNVQFALNPKSEEYRVIEVNPRLSRSSALASKATGYPIAYIAAKLALGYNLFELPNKVTGVTTACFEPSLDYVVVKVPRWDLEKFQRVSRELGPQMKSVGEVMAIGRGFEEALQKAFRQIGKGWEGLTDISRGHSLKRIKKELSTPTDKRLFFVVEAFRKKMPVKKIRELSKIDPWFLRRIKKIVELEEKLKENKLEKELLWKAKKLGFSDKRIAQLKQSNELNIRKKRTSLGVKPVVKQIDTLAAEWPAQTNYLYLTYNGKFDDIPFKKRKKAVVLGSGTYRIGSSVEFDWCCVNTAWSLKEKGLDEVIMVNCNPETVSTDFDVLDKLYFEEISLERVLDICEKESPKGIVVSVGGQAANNLATGLSNSGLKILGTKAKNIDNAENRKRFSALVDKIGLKQPRWTEARDLKQAKGFAESIGFPVLIRPSYVLSGAAMKVAFTEKQLEEFLSRAAEVSKEHPVVVSKFIRGGKEVEVDGVSDGKRAYLGAIIEHVEQAGTHSGDATMSIPPLSLNEKIREKVKFYAEKIALALKIKGPFNIQFIVSGENIYVIECNLRSSRSMPFVSKSTGVNLMDLAVDAMLGLGIESGGPVNPENYCVKAPQFSFLRLEGADPVSGVEMASTGEVACFGQSFEEAFTLALEASGFRIPKKGDYVLLTTGGKKKPLIPIAKSFTESGLKLMATVHTARALNEAGLDCTVLFKVHEDQKPNALDFLKNGKIQLVVNIPSNERESKERVLEDEYLIRRTAVEFGVPIITNLELAGALARALKSKSI